MNTFGQRFRVTTWGESHGKAIGCIVDGCPAGLPLEEVDFNLDMSRRRPGQSVYTTARKEEDKVEILSGVFEGRTTGTPISLIVYNMDQKSRDYSDIKNKYRPNHADYTYQEKYHIRDYRGGGRSSARETAMRVAAGVIAKKVLNIQGIEIIAYMASLGNIPYQEDDFNEAFINQNEFFCPSPKTLESWKESLKQTRKKGDSIGAKITVYAKNMPIGLGEPIYYKLDAQLASYLMSINAVKSVEIGTGVDFLKKKGADCADEIRKGTSKAQFLSNHSGGVLGGISSGQDLLAHIVVKPTSSITQEKKTINKQGENTSIVTKGRHDPCVGIRAVPVVEAMVACLIVDLYLLNKGCCIDD